MICVRCDEVCSIRSSDPRGWRTIWGCQGMVLGEEGTGGMQYASIRMQVHNHLGVWVCKHVCGVCMCMCCQ